MPSVFPSPDEQKAITAFLDWHGLLVRRAIRNKQRLIELLNAQKQAIINRVVTRGLDANVELKLSGLDWLDDVPQHWTCAGGAHAWSAPHVLGRAATLVRS